MTQRPTSVEIAARDLGWKPGRGDRVWTRHMGIKHYRLGIVGSKYAQGLEGYPAWWVDFGKDQENCGPYRLSEMWPVLR